GGWAADRLQKSYGRRGRAMVPLIGMSAGGVLLLLGVLAEDTAWMVTWLALALAAMGSCEAAVWTTAIELGGRQGGTAAGICNTGGNAGGVLGPWITPVVAGAVTSAFDLDTKSGWQWAMSLGSLVAILGALVWLWIAPDDT